MFFKYFRPTNKKSQKNDNADSFAELRITVSCNREEEKLESKLIIENCSDILIAGFLASLCSGNTIGNLIQNALISYGETDIQKERAKIILDMLDKYFSSCSGNSQSPLINASSVLGRQN